MAFTRHYISASYIGTGLQDGAFNIYHTECGKYDNLISYSGSFDIPSSSLAQGIVLNLDDSITTLYLTPAITSSLDCPLGCGYEYVLNLTQPTPEPTTPQPTTPTPTPEPTTPSPIVIATPEPTPEPTTPEPTTPAPSGATPEPSTPTPTPEPSTPAPIVCEQLIVGIGFVSLGENEIDACESIPYILGSDSTSLANATVIYSSSTCTTLMGQVYLQQGGSYRYWDGSTLGPLTACPTPEPSTPQPTTPEPTTPEPTTPEPTTPAPTPPCMEYLYENRSFYETGYIEYVDCQGVYQNLYVPANSPTLSLCAQVIIYYTPSVIYIEEDGPCVQV